MSPTVIILLMAAVTYLPRLAGFMLSGQRVPPFWLRFLRFVPISVFAVLIAPALPGTGGLTARLGAALVAVLLMWRLRNLAIGLVGGLATFWLLRML